MADGNVYNRRLYFSKVTQQQYTGPSPQAPVNHFTMLTDYAPPEQRNVACANQDVVYGMGALGLDLSPVVIQVPDFGDRFWVYQIVDLRTDSFVQLGKMYNTTPGFYLLVGPDWQGEAPRGITKVFRSPTNTGLVGPRIAQNDTAEDKKAVQQPLTQVLMYPLADFDGAMKCIDWSGLPHLPAKAPTGRGETKWVFPETFFDVLPAVLADGPPLPGEEARYAQVLAVLDALERNPALKASMIAAATEADQQVVEPLFEFRNYGQQLPHHWSTISNESAFGTDCGREIEHSRQLPAGDEVLLPGPRRNRRTPQRCPSLHGHVREGSDTTGHRLLVPDHVQRRALLRAERDRTLLGWYEEQGPAVRSRRLVDHLRSIRRADGPTSARELAAGTQGRRFLALRPRLLA
jgi:hypothetical protein